MKILKGIDFLLILELPTVDIEIQHKSCLVRAYLTDEFVAHYKYLTDEL